MSVLNVYKVAGLNAAGMYDRETGCPLMKMVVFVRSKCHEYRAASPITLTGNPEQFTIEKLIRFRRYARRMARKQGWR